MPPRVVSLQACPRMPRRLQQLHLSTSTPRSPASRRALGWSRAGSSASCTPSCQLLASAASLFPWCGRIRPYPGMAAPALGRWASVGGKGGACLGRFASNNVHPWQSWAGGRSTGLDSRAPEATASSWSHYPSLSQVPQILEAQVAQLPTSLGPRGPQRVGCVRTGALVT